MKHLYSNINNVNLQTENTIFRNNQATDPPDSVLHVVSDMD